MRKELKNYWRNYAYNNSNIECVERKQYYAEQADKLNNTVLTLQQWGDMIIESNKGDSNE